MSSSKSLTIKEWSEADQPREKLLLIGKKNLSNAELLGILLGSGSIGKDAVSLAKEILDDNDGDLRKLVTLEVSDFMKYNGIGTAKAVTIQAAFELGWRMRYQENPQKEYFARASNDFADYIFDKLYDKVIDIDHEEFWVILLNNRNKIIHSQCIAVGGMSNTTVDIRRLFRIVLERKATTIAVMHNHPAGSLVPSSADDRLTQQIVDAANLLDIRVLDHIIVGFKSSGEPSYYSYADMGRI